MAINPRIDELRRRVEKDPTSIAFAQLAEEYRRTRDYLQAVRVCRDGLARHPGYISAQVTLGRALIELRQFDEARKELKAVLAVAPDNLAAIRALASLHDRDDEPLPDLRAPGEAEQAQEPPVAAQQDALPDVAVAPEVTVAPGVIVPTAFSAATPLDEGFLSVEEDATPVRVEIDPALRELESWLAAIVADRALPH